MKQNPYTVYVVQLAADVWRDKKFRDANPGIDAFKAPAAYIGSTGKDIKKRFEEHKAGLKHNKYVKNHGVSVAEISRHATWAEANKAEIEAAIRLRKKGIGIFQK